MSNFDKEALIAKYKNDEDFATLVRDSFNRYLYRVVKGKIMAEHRPDVAEDTHPVYVGYSQDRRKEPRLMREMKEFGFVIESGEKMRSFVLTPGILKAEVVLSYYGEDPMVAVSEEISSCVHGGRLGALLTKIDARTLYGYYKNPELYTTTVVEVEDSYLRGRVTELVPVIIPVGLNERIFSGQERILKERVAAYTENLFGVAQEVFGEENSAKLREAMDGVADLEWNSTGSGFGRPRYSRPSGADDIYPFVARLRSTLQGEMDKTREAIRELKMKEERIYAAVKCYSDEDFQLLAKAYEKDIEETIASEKGKGWVQEAIDKAYKWR